MLPRLAAAAGVDVVHSLANTGPARGGFARVITIHDLLYRMVARSALRPARAAACGCWCRWRPAARDRVIAISQQHARRRRPRACMCRGDRIDVVPQGVGRTARATAMPEARAARAVRAGRPADRPQRLDQAGAQEPPTAARGARALIPAERRPLLVLPGYPTAARGRAAARRPRPGDRRRRALPRLAERPPSSRASTRRPSASSSPRSTRVSACRCSRRWRRGVPVACSERSSIPEVAGNAARCFDPERPDDIAAAITELLDDPAERERLREAGRPRPSGSRGRPPPAARVASYERALS